MTNRTIRVQDIIARNEESVQFEGFISTEFPIKEIFELRYKLLQPIRTIMGKKYVAFFGEIEVNAYCVDEQEQTIRLAQRNLHFKGFSGFSELVLNKQQAVKVELEVYDIFPKITEPNCIRIMGLLGAELVLTTEREICMGEFQCYQHEPCDYYNLRSDSINQTSSQPEIFTDVDSGQTQNISIILDE